MAGTLQRLREWAIDPETGGRLFAWGTSSDLDRARVFFRDKLPAHVLADWCVSLRELALAATRTAESAALAVATE